MTERRVIEVRETPEGPLARLSCYHLKELDVAPRVGELVDCEKCDLYPLPGAQAEGQSVPPPGASARHVVAVRVPLPDGRWAMRLDSYAFVESTYLPAEA